MTIELNDLVVVGNSSENPFAIDVAYALGQIEDIADVISLKEFKNSELCPRFISDENDLSSIGESLSGKTVIIVSTSSHTKNRQELAMSNLIIARSAKENGARFVLLLEPDLFYSAQDRGARNGLGEVVQDRSEKDRKKFDGQPFTAKLYAEMLKIAGVDGVVTVHNHSTSVQSVFKSIFAGNFHNLVPYDIYTHYLLHSDIVDHKSDGEGLVLCAPDAGARDFVRNIFENLGLPKAKCILLEKKRFDERHVEIALSPESDIGLEELAGCDIVLFDDMVRTGGTVVKSCQFLKQAKPGRIVFALSHFYASDEGRERLANPVVDEILTLNTLPTILNRDVQGRLRKKMVVLKVELWLAHQVRNIMNVSCPEPKSYYRIDMSSKNPRFTKKVWDDKELVEKFLRTDA